MQNWKDEADAAAERSGYSAGDVLVAKSSKRTSYDVEVAWPLVFSLFKFKKDNKVGLRKAF